MLEMEISAIMVAGNRVHFRVLYWESAELIETLLADGFTYLRWVSSWMLLGVDT